MYTLYFYVKSDRISVRPRRPSPKTEGCTSTGRPCGDIAWLCTVYDGKWKFMTPSAGHFLKHKPLLCWCHKRIKPPQGFRNESESHFSHNPKVSSFTHFLLSWTTLLIKGCNRINSLQWFHCHKCTFYNSQLKTWHLDGKMQWKQTKRQKVSTSWNHHHVLKLLQPSAKWQCLFFPNRSCDVQLGNSMCSFSASLQRIEISAASRQEVEG